MTAPETATYDVVGMTCAHCVSAVQEELGTIDGVTEVAVDLVVDGASRVTVSSEQAPDEAAVRAAVDEAGYALA